MRAAPLLWARWIPETKEEPMRLNHVNLVVDDLAKAQDFF